MLKVFNNVYVLNANVLFNKFDCKQQMNDFVMAIASIADLMSFTPLFGGEKQVKEATKCLQAICSKYSFKIWPKLHKNLCQLHLVILVPFNIFSSQ